jgi:hypothetical protein
MTELSKQSQKLIDLLMDKLREVAWRLGYLEQENLKLKERLKEIKGESL